MKFNVTIEQTVIKTVEVDINPEEAGINPDDSEGTMMSKAKCYFDNKVEELALNPTAKIDEDESETSVYDIEKVD